MRYLGIDYGSRRIGLALSDLEGRLAFPRGMARSLEEISAIVRRQEVGVVVVGLPRTLAGRDSAETRRVRAFASRLAKSVQLPIEFEDERFTTKIAEGHTARANTDASAAAIILQSYLDKQRL